MEKSVTQPVLVRQAFPDPIPNYVGFSTICTLSGASGTGKTRLIAGWLKRWRDHQPICGHATNVPPAIGVIAVDRRWSQYQPLFDLIGWPDIPHFSFRDLAAFEWKKLKTIEGRMWALNYALDKLNLPPGSLITIDPLAMFVTNQLIDYYEVAIGMSEIDKVIKARQLTIIGTFHVHKVYANPKDRTLRPQDRILGSGAQLAFTDTAMYLASPAETGESYFELGWIPHNAIEEQHHFIRDSHGLFIPYRAADGLTGDDRAMQMLNLIPTTGGIHAAVLVEQAKENYGTPERTAYRDLQRLRTLCLVETEDQDGSVRRRKVS